MTLYALIEVTKEGDTWIYETMSIWSSLELLETVGLQDHIKNNYEYYGGPDSPDLAKILHWRVYVCEVDPTEPVLGIRWTGLLYDKLGNRIIVAPPYETDINSNQENL